MVTYLYSPPNLIDTSTPGSSTRSSSASTQPSASHAIHPMTISTRPIPLSSGVVFERHHSLHPPSDDDIIIVTVRLSDKFRKRSLERSEDLPQRPNKRSFLRRLSTHFGTSEENGMKIKAVKMPRGDYKRWFARDRNGVYVGTEEEREWDEEDLRREFEAYQALPIHRILG